MVAVQPFAPLHLLLFLLLLAFLLALLQVGVISLAFEKLGLSAESAMLLLFGSLFGSAVNLPLFSLRSALPPGQTELPPPLRQLLRMPRIPFTGRTVIAVNLGGGLIPIFFSLYLLHTHTLAADKVVLAVTLVTLVAYAFSRPIPGLGIGMPLFVAPLAAAITALAIDPDHGPALAYVCGTLGVLLGADVLRLKDIRRLATPIASIGGAGTFDGIFLTGIVAVLLA